MTSSKLGESSLSECDESVVAYLADGQGTPVLDSTGGNITEEETVGDETPVA